LHPYLAQPPILAHVSQAMMHVQRHTDVSRTALAGYLRSNATEITKAYAEIRDSATIYKISLLNSRACAGIEYIPALAKFEDIAFLRQLLLSGKSTLKVQTYSCDAMQRSSNTMSRMPLSRLAELPPCAAV
jgi:hypothetical protein